MGMRSWVKWVLFGSSYTPFFAILLWRDRFDHPLLSWVLVGLMIGSNVVLGLLLLRTGRLSADRSGKVARRSSKTGDALNYIVTYIIPFLEFKPLLLLTRRAPAVGGELRAAVLTEDIYREVPP
jgi:hypothetical protein